MVQQAGDEARRLGMPDALRTAGSLRERTRTAAAQQDPLTGREREIATLVGSAMTNRQIADQLVLSERTIESHVRNILAKLGAANPTEIATSAVRFTSLPCDPGRLPGVRLHYRRLVMRVPPQVVPPCPTGRPTWHPG